MAGQGTKYIHTKCRTESTPVDHWSVSRETSSVHIHTLSQPKHEVSTPPISIYGYVEGGPLVAILESFIGGSECGFQT